MQNKVKSVQLLAFLNKRANRRYFDDTNTQTEFDMSHTMDKRRVKSKKKKQYFKGLRSYTMIKDMPYWIENAPPYAVQALSDKSSSKHRVSFDHLTFNQIKLERIKQERNVDTVQKNLKILKHNMQRQESLLK